MCRGHEDSVRAMLHIPENDQVQCIFSIVHNVELHLVIIYNPAVCDSWLGQDPEALVSLSATDSYFIAIFFYPRIFFRLFFIAQMFF